MLTPAEQSVVDLRAEGLSPKEVARRLAISRVSEKVRAWKARQKKKAGDPLTLPGMGVYCVFRFGPSYIGILPLRMLPRWTETVWKAKDRLPTFARLKRRPEPEILLGAIIHLTWPQAKAARRLLAPKRKPGVYRVGPRGKVTKFSGEKAAARALRVNSMAIRQYRERGHERGRYFWL